MPRPSHKSTLFTRILPELKKQTPFFSINAVKRALSAARIKLPDQTIHKYMSEAMAEGIVHDAGRGWYTRHKETHKLDPKPVQKLIRTVRKNFPLLRFQCWSTLQFNLFAHHLFGQPTTFLYADRDTLRPVADRLRQMGWEAWANPSRSETGRFISPGKKTVVLRPLISKLTPTANHLAPVEIALVDFMIETQKMYLTDVSESHKITANCFESGKIQLSDFIEYSKMRGLKIPAEISSLLNPKRV